MKSGQEFFLTVLVAAGFAVSAAAQDNFLQNPGFEQSSAFTVPAEWEASKTLVDATELPGQWSLNQIYQGKLGKLAVINDPEMSHGGAKYLRIEGFLGLMHGDGAPKLWPTKPGEKFLFSVWAKGKGTLEPYAYLYNKFGYQTQPLPCLSQPWDISSPKWEKHEWELVIPAAQDLASADPNSKSYPVVAQFAVAFHTTGGSVDLDDVLLLPVSAETATPQAARPAISTDEMRLPLVGIAKTGASPRIDGQLSPDEWKYASAITGFVTLTEGKLTGDDTTFYLMYDDRNLYCAFRTTVPDKPLAQAQNEAEGNLFQDDLFEIYLQPDAAATVYYQFAGNAAGALYDAKGKDFSWNSNALYKSQCKDSGETVGGISTFARSVWTGEIAIPFKSMGLISPGDGSSWRANFCRDWSGVKREWERKWTSWSPTGGDFHSLANLGFLSFNATMPAVRLLSYGDPAGGSAAIEGTIFNPGTTKRMLLDSLSVCLLDSGKEIVRQEESLEAAPAAESRFECRKEIELIKTLPLRLVFSIRDQENGETLYRSSVAFDSLPNFMVDTAVFPFRGIAEITIDTKRLPNFSGDKFVVVEIFNRTTNQSVQTIPIKDLSDRNRVVTQNLDIAKFSPGEYQAKAYLKDSGGNIVAQAIKDFTVPGKPEWLKNQLGISDQVPAPWTPVIVKGKSVTVWGREYRFKGMPFPNEIITLGKPLLSSPMDWQLVTDKGLAVWEENTFECLSKSDLKVVFRTVNRSHDVRMEGETTIEYDGFIRTDITLTPLVPLVIKSLLLKIPLKAENALYMKGYKFYLDGGICSSWYAACLYPGAAGPATFKVASNWHYSTTGWPWKNEFMHSVWAGGDEAGISVTFDSDQNFQTANYVEVKEGKANQELTFNFIDSPYPFEKALTYTVALQATPVKPMPTDPRRLHYGYMVGEKAEKWNSGDVAVACGLSSGAGYPKLNKMAEWMIPDFREHGVLYGPYHSGGWFLTETQDFQLFGKEWETVPHLKLNWDAWNNDWVKNATATVVCLRSGYPDYFVWGVNKLIEAGCTSINFDWAGIGYCINQRHGCGYIGKDGQVKGTINLFNARETYKRIYTLGKMKNPDFFIFNHAVPIPPLVSFVDGSCEAEEWNVPYYNNFDLLPDFFRPGFYMYRQYGVPFSLYWIKDPKTPLDVIPICLLHNIYPTFMGGQKNGPLAPYWAIMDDWILATEWYPYWKNSQFVQSSNAELKTGVYLKKAEGRGLVLIANLAKTSAAGEVKLNLGNLGFNDKIRIKELLEGKETPLENSGISVSLPPNSVRFFLLEQR